MNGAIWRGVSRLLVAQAGLARRLAHALGNTRIKDPDRDGMRIVLLGSQR